MREQGEGRREEGGEEPGLRDGGTRVGCLETGGQERAGWSFGIHGLIVRRRRVIMCKRAGLNFRNEKRGCTGAWDGHSAGIIELKMGVRALFGAKSETIGDFRFKVDLKTHGKWCI